MVSTKNFEMRISLLYLFLSVFAAFASYRAHLEGFETVVSAGLEAIVNFEGRAPDQYRIFPYLLMNGIKEGLELITQSEWTWKYPILIFESLSLFCSALVLHRIMGKANYKIPVLIVFFLIYPYLMFDGVRSIASFILFLSSYTLYLSLSKNSRGIRILFFCILLIFSFTRADIALLIGLIASIYLGMTILEKCLVAFIPLVIQVSLSSVLFPSAEYYSDVLMIEDNLALAYFLGNPVTYLLIAISIQFWGSIYAFIRKMYLEQRPVLTLLAGYCLVLLLIARPNEYRLLLPFLPVILTMIDKVNIQPK